MREIPLPNGMVALIDDEDWPRVSLHSWLVRPITKARRSWYALIMVGKRTLYLHRFILNAGPGEIVDHANRDGLDNRKRNLRKCTKAQNCANSDLAPGATGFRGVDSHPNSLVPTRFRGRVYSNRKVRRGPWRQTALEAAHDRDIMAKQAHGEFAVLNFLAAQNT